MDKIKTTAIKIYIIRSATDAVEELMQIQICHTMAV